MQIDINLSPGQWHEWSTSRVSRSKVKITGGWSYLWKPGSVTIFKLSLAWKWSAILNRNAEIYFELFAETHCTNKLTKNCRGDIFLWDILYTWAMPRAVKNMIPDRVSMPVAYRELSCDDLTQSRHHWRHFLTQLFCRKRKQIRLVTFSVRKYV